MTNEQRAWAESLIGKRFRSHEGEGVVVGWTAPSKSKRGVWLTLRSSLDASQGLHFVHPLFKMYPKRLDPEKNGSDEGYTEVHVFSGTKGA